jgi:hypothetical protein
MEVTIMGMYVRLDKLSDDGRLVKYAFAEADGRQRTLVFDRQEERVWPEDDNRDGIFRGAAQALAKAWYDRHELPEKLLHQA